MCNKLHRNSCKIPLCVYDRSTPKTQRLARYYCTCKRKHYRTINRTIHLMELGGLFMMKKINLLVLLVLFSLVNGLTLAIFVVLGFLLRIMEKGFRSDLSGCVCVKQKSWATIGASRILVKILLHLTALLIKGLNYMNHRILTVIQKRFTGGKI